MWDRLKALFKKYNRFIWNIIFILVVFAALYPSSDSPEDTYVNASSIAEFEAIVNSPKVSQLEDVAIHKDTDMITYRLGDKEYKVNYPFEFLVFNQDLEEKLRKNNVETSYPTESGYSTLAIIGFIFSVLPTLFMILIIIFLVRSVSTDFKPRKVEKTTVKFDDVVGYESAKQELREILEIMSDPLERAKMKSGTIKGILLSGPPGTGKTQLAKALATEAKAGFVYASGSDLEGKYVGEGSARIKTLMKTAKDALKQYPWVVVCIDEIDSIGIDRERRTVSETNQTLNTLLTSMSGFDADDKILFVAMTNLASRLDGALLRSGRFDRKIEIGFPTKKERKAIIEYYLRKLGDKVDEKVYSQDFPAILATQTSGKVGADFEALVKEAELIARRHKKEKIDPETLRDALIRMTLGTKTDLDISAEELKIIAYHEAGHAVAKILTDSRGIGSIAYMTVDPSGSALGHVAYVGDESILRTKTSIENRIICALAGRSVEKMIFEDGNFTEGAANDLMQVNDMLLEYVTKLGMSKHLPNMYIRNLDENSEAVQEAIRLEREDLSLRTDTMIRGNYETLVVPLAEALLTHQYLDQQKIEEVLSVDLEEI